LGARRVKLVASMATRNRSGGEIQYAHVSV
jgi:hypothetical protein